MTEGGFFKPIGSALALAKRWPSVVVWAVLILMAMASRALLTQSLSSRPVARLLMIETALAFVPVLIGALLGFFLARTLIASPSVYLKPLYGRFLGFTIAASLVAWLISTTGRVAIFTSDPSQFMSTYGSILVGSFASIATFPFLVRALTAAAGMEEPRLGGIVSFAFGEGWSVYFWYAICAILFPVLMVFTFANMLDSGNQANFLPGNAFQSVITGSGSLLKYLLALVLAQATIPDGRRLAETFA